MFCVINCTFQYQQDFNVSTKVGSNKIKTSEKHKNNSYFTQKIGKTLKNIKIG